MTMNTHTPGPWKAELVPSSFEGNNHFRVMADSPHAPGLAQVVCEINGPWAHENYRANARLIAAAPDLLAALEDVMSDPYFAKASTRYAHARAAIAAARGA